MKQRVLLNACIIFLVILSSSVFAQSHSLSQIEPADVDLDMNGYNIVNLGCLALNEGQCPEAVTVSGGMSVSLDPDSDDDIPRRGYMDTRYAASSHSHDAVFAREMDAKEDLSTETSYSGFFQSSTATTAENWPENTGTWAYLIANNPGTSGYYGMQFSGNFYNQNLYYRSPRNSGSSAWTEVWHSGSDGTGSGLDADVIDNIQGSSFLRSDAADIHSGGYLQFRTGLDIGGGVNIDDDTTGGTAGAGELEIADGSLNVCDYDCTENTQDGYATIERNVGVQVTGPSSALSLGVVGSSSYAIYTGSSKNYGGQFHGQHYGCVTKGSGATSGTIYGAIARGYTTGTAGEAVALRAQVSRSGSGTYYSGYFYDSGTGGSYNGLWADYRTGGAIDVAEVIYDLGDTEPADVVVPVKQQETVQKSSKPFDTSVIGVITTEPHMILGIDIVTDEEGDRIDDQVNATQITLIGRVPVKVTDENGPIKIGDLLTTSSTPGHAMKWDLINLSTANNLIEMKQIVKENDKRRHAVFAKALEAHDSGEGKIIALVTLQ